MDILNKELYHRTLTADFWDNSRVYFGCCCAPGIGFTVVIQSHVLSFQNRKHLQSMSDGLSMVDYSSMHFFKFGKHKYSTNWKPPSVSVRVGKCNCSIRNETIWNESVMARSLFHPSFQFEPTLFFTPSISLTLSYSLSLSSRFFLSVNFYFLFLHSSAYLWYRTGIFAVTAISPYIHGWYVCVWVWVWVLSCVLFGDAVRGSIKNVNPNAEEKLSTPGLCATAQQRWSQRQQQQPSRYHCFATNVFRMEMHISR